jgi:5-methylcytosine-specific restriction enzyme subunit McrC
MNTIEYEDVQIGFVGKIPVRNLWLLMLYASRLLKEENPALRSVEENPDDIPNLIAEILARRVEKRIRRGLTVTYIEECKVLTRVRGRINFLQTHQHHYLQQGKISCRYQSLDVNIKTNQFVGAALLKAAELVARSDSGLAHRCRSLAGSMTRAGVVCKRPTRAAMSADQTAHSGRQDREMLTAAKLLFELALPTELEGTRKLSELERGTYIRKLFEEAIGGFCEVVLGPQGYEVFTSKKFKWPVDDLSDGMSGILPGMEGDIVLETPSKNHRTIIDTKFTEILTKGQFGQDRLKSGYLYQIYAYLRSQEDTDHIARYASGLMLHPSAGCSVDESTLIQGHWIRFATVDLAAPGTEIRAQLLHRLT